MKKLFSTLLGYLSIVIVFALFCGVIFFLVSPIIWWSDLSEIRLYARIFLVLFGLNVFAVLRLYNSIVQNTRFSYKLKESINKLIGNIPVLDRAIRGLSNSLIITKTSSDGLRKSIDSSQSKVEELINTLNKIKNSPKIDKDA